MVTRRSVLCLMMVLALAGAIGLTGHPAKSAPAFTLDVATADVEGKPEKILVDAKGQALYYLTSDTPTSSVCTGACAGNWPPLLSDSTPTAPSSVTGKLAVVKTANGSQVSYNDHLLYRLMLDTKPGQALGHNRKGPSNGDWRVATPGSAKSNIPGTSPPGGDTRYH